ncbi:MAG TPA: hypothetical protein VD887_13345 [Allosphingosinicella sp.]|nr:hypothetical protein [Allosphingosinicella sp.]HYG31185.1 hypothetical protein [Allosphingosinicella sp.]
MGYIVGAAIALGVAAFAALSGFDRDRAFWPTVLIVTASYYVLFAALAAADSALAPEILSLALFAALAVIGFRTSLWVVAAGLAAHAVFDLLRGGLIANPGVPVWWPDFCIGFDVAAAACVAWLLMRRGVATPLR